jgi:hypothetical protein
VDKLTINRWSLFEYSLEEDIKLALTLLGVLNIVNLSTQKVLSVSGEAAICQALDESAQMDFPVSIEAGLEFHKHLPVHH